MKPKFKVGEIVRAGNLQRYGQIIKVRLDQNYEGIDAQFNGFYYQLKGEQRVLGASQWWHENTLHKTRKQKSFEAQKP